jgi:hypothetical protein
LLLRRCREGNRASGNDKAAPFPQRLDARGAFSIVIRR